MELAAAIHILQRSAAAGRPAQSHSVDDRSRDGYDLASWHRQCFWHLRVVCHKSLGQNEIPTTCGSWGHSSHSLDGPRSLFQDSLLGVFAIAIQ